MDLETFFQLEIENVLFKQAITPPSCGGGEEFKNLAKFGDNFLNEVLNTYFTNIGIIDSGALTIKIQEFHNSRTLTKLGRKLSIQDYLIPIVSNHVIQDNDTKEAIESLIEVSRRTNGEKIASEIILDLYKIAEENNFLDSNPIGALNEYFQKKTGTSIPSIEVDRVGGLDHLPLFQATYSLEIENHFYIAKSGLFSKKDDCKRDVAFKILNQIYNIEQPEYHSANLGISNLITTKELSSTPKISIFDKEIVFCRPNYENNSHNQVNLSQDTGENIVKWAQRKAKKNPFGMLLLLSARVDEISGASWSASLNEGELTLLNLTVQGEMYFEIGFGFSKSKSKKDAGLKMIEKTNLHSWLEENFPNRNI